ncbi:hypothetical protein [Faecalibacillus intestinalis]|uniref:hypothetical protein n=1 Tax=Faecalibacillus intestinalis TaxID=1982626 RepID=UPI003AB32D68
MKKKYEVLFYIDKLSTQKNQNNPSKMLFSTKELASYLNIQRSNLSAILNELVRENKLEKISGRPALYKIHNKLDENDLIFATMSSDEFKKDKHYPKKNFFYGICLFCFR